MTHDELLALIDKCEDFAAMNGATTGAHPALSAVVELHKPFNVGDEVLCEGCCQHVYLTDYPCPTIQAIEKELG